MHWGGSVLETMRFEKIETEKITQDAASVALTDTFELMKLQRKAERKSIFMIGICVASLLLLIFLVDNIGWLVFAMAYFPAICLLESIVLAIYGIWRKKKDVYKRQDIDRHHKGAASKVSNGLITADKLKTLFDPYFKVNVVISDNQMYQVSGVKRQA